MLSIPAHKACKNIAKTVNFKVCWHVFSQMQGELKSHSMKRFFTLLFIFFSLASFTRLIGIEEVVASLNAGNATQIARHFDNTVEITLPDKTNSYSKSQAEIILKDFFNNNSVKGFQVLHKGDKSGSQFCIGKLVTKTNAYRTTIFMKQKGDRQVLQEIRFEN